MILTQKDLFSLLGDLISNPSRNKKRLSDQRLQNRSRDLERHTSYYESLLERSAALSREVLLSECAVGIDLLSTYYDPDPAWAPTFAWRNHDVKRRELQDVLLNLIVKVGTPSVKKRRRSGSSKR